MAYPNDLFSEVLYDLNDITKAAKRLTELNGKIEKMKTIKIRTFF